MPSAVEGATTSLLPVLTTLVSRGRESNLNLEQQKKKQKDNTRMTEFLRKRNSKNFSFYDTDQLDMDEMVFNSSLNLQKSTRQEKARTAERACLRQTAEDTGAEMANLHWERDARNFQLLASSTIFDQMEEEDIISKGQLWSVQTDHWYTTRLLESVLKEQKEKSAQLEENYKPLVNAKEMILELKCKILGIEETNSDVEAKLADTEEKKKKKNSEQLTAL